MKKILILSANPINTDRLRLDEEVREIQSALERSRRREQFELIPRWAVRIDDLRRALLDHEPQIVHFSGHGTGTDGLVLEDNFRQTQQQRKLLPMPEQLAGIALANESGQMQLVSTKSLTDLFELFKDTIECVLLNACYSEVQAEEIYKHIDCVIGMKRSIQDRAALDFSKGFYDAIGAGRTYEDGFKFGCNNINLNGIPESLIPVIKTRQISLVDSGAEKNIDRKQIELTRNSGFEVTEPSSGQNQVNTLSGINSGGSFLFAPVQAGGNVTSSPKITQPKTQTSDLKEVLSLLAQLKQDITQTENLNLLLKAGAFEQVEKLENELKKPEPDNNLVKRTIDTLKQGLEGVLALAEPTAKVASLIAKLWGVSLP